MLQRGALISTGGLCLVATLVLTEWKFALIARRRIPQKLLTRRAGTFQEKSRPARTCYNGALDNLVQRGPAPNGPRRSRRTFQAYSNRSDRIAADNRETRRFLRACSRNPKLSYIGKILTIPCDLLGTAYCKHGSQPLLSQCR